MIREISKQLTASERQGERWKFFLAIFVAALALVYWLHPNELLTNGALIDGLAIGGLVGAAFGFLVLGNAGER